MKNRIKELRQINNLTQQEFADRLNIKRGTLANYELGRNEPIDAVVTLICREFGVNENWLRYGIGDMKTETDQRQKLSRFFADVLATAPDERSAFVAALDDLPPEFWPMIADLARNYVDALKKEEAQETEQKNTQAESRPGRTIIKIAGRDGSLEERALTGEEMERLRLQAETLPDAPEDF